MKIQQPLFEVRHLPHRVTMIQEADHREVVASYLVEGNRQTAVIDAGLGSGGFPALIASLSSRQPVVLQTHLHWDHIGASQHFRDVRAHATELSVRRVDWPWEPDTEDEPIENADGDAGRRESTRWPPGAALRVSGLLQAGDQIDLGGRTLEVFHTPGHSPGSLSFLDRDTGALFCGDLLYHGQILLFVAESDLAAYRRSLHALGEIASDLQAIYPAHGPAPLTPQDLLAMRAAFDEVSYGRTPDWHGSYAQRRVAIHDFGPFAFLLPRVTG